MVNVSACREAVDALLKKLSGVCSVCGEKLVQAEFVDVVEVECPCGAFVHEGCQPSGGKWCPTCEGKVEVIPMPGNAPTPTHKESERGWGLTLPQEG